MRWTPLILVAAVVGCSDPDDPPDADLCPIAGTASVEIGVPDPIQFIAFEPLAAGGDIPLSSNGQTFLAVQLALRAQNVARFAHVGLDVTYDPLDGSTARVASKDSVPLERLFCRDDDRLHLVPVVVSSEDLGSDIEIQDKGVSITMTVEDEDGRTASASASGVLRRL